MKNKIFNKDDLLQELFKNNVKFKYLNEIYNSYSNLTELFDDGETMLHLCVKKGFLNSVQWLLDKKIDPNIRNTENVVALFYTIDLKNILMSKLLVQYKADVNILNNYNRTLLQESIIASNQLLIDFLIPKTTNLNNCDVYGHNIIFDSIANGSEVLLRKISSLNGVNINQVDLQGNTILQNEAVLLNKDLSITLMELGADPTILVKNGKSFLFHSVFSGAKNIDIIEKAVSLGYDISHKSMHGTTLLIESLDQYLICDKDDEDKFSHYKMFGKLLKLGIEVNVLDKKNETEFFKILKSEDQKLINLFVEMKIIGIDIDIDHKNIDGNTLLMIMALRGIESIKQNLEIFRLASPNIKDKYDNTIIETLIDIILYSQSNKEITQLLKNKINPDAEYMSVLKTILTNNLVDFTALDKDGKPLFFRTILNCNFSLFMLLKNNGADINQNDINGNNVIYNILEERDNNKFEDKSVYLETLKNLIYLNMDMNHKNSTGETVLHKAISGDCIDTVKILLSSKVNLLIKDNLGRSIVHNCVWNQNIDYYKLIHLHNKEVINQADIYGVTPINYAAFMGRNNLVFDMLNTGALVSNSHHISSKMKLFLKKFYNSLDSLLLANNGSQVNTANLELLVTNMKKEFFIKD